MKLSILLTALAACSTIVANPVNPAQNILYKRADSAVSGSTPAAGAAPTAAAATSGSGIPTPSSSVAPAASGSSAPAPSPSTASAASGSSAASSAVPSAVGSAGGSNTTAPAGGSNTTAPAGGSNTTAPAGGSNTTAPAGGSNTTAPAGGSNTTAPAGGSNTTAPAGGSNTTAPAGGSNTTAPAGGSNTTAGTYSNGTTGVTSGSNSTTNNSGTVAVFITGGTNDLTNSSGVSVINLFNSSQALNITQLYALAARINNTLGLQSTQSVVIVSNQESLEPLGFFTSLVFNTDKPIVITQSAAFGAAIARQSSASARGPLVIGDNRLLYPGVFAPTGDDSSSCAAVGIASDASNATWFFEKSTPALVSPSSALKQNYSNFTNYNVSSVPVVPIIYDGGYSTQLISSLPSAAGFVVVSSGSNSTLSSVGNSSSPVVFAEGGSGLHYIGNEDVPAGTIPAGYLSPVKSQILLSVAAVNGVKDQQSLRSLFP